jgi:hypothetical protein
MYSRQKPILVERNQASHGGEYEMLRRVDFVRSDFLEEHIASIIRVARIDEVGTTLAINSNRNTLRSNITKILL